MQADISLTPRVESAWFQLLESTYPFKPLVSNVDSHPYTAEAPRRKITAALTEKGAEALGAVVNMLDSADTVWHRCKLIAYV